MTGEAPHDLVDVQGTPGEELDDDRVLRVVIVDDTLDMRDMLRMTLDYVGQPDLMHRAIDITFEWLAARGLYE